MNYLPFNLQEALKAPSRVVYRNGEKPLEWHFFEKDPQKYPIIAVHPISGSDKFTIEGSYYRDMTHRLDLFLLPPPEKRYWVNVYKDPDRGICTGYMTYSSEEMARLHISKVEDEYIKTISFTI